MKKINFNDGWRFRRLNKDEQWQNVSVPHDAAMYEKRTMDAEAGVNTGWFSGCDYEYEKNFLVPAEYDLKDVVLEFEGVYHNAEVYINGERACFRPYGYTNFYVVCNRYLSYGAQNLIRVIARNADQPNSRWYSGAGIYRPVTMYIGEKKRIELNGVKIRTLSIHPATVEVFIKATGDGNVSIEIEKNGKVVATSTGELVGGCARAVLTIDDAKLWTIDTPELYDCRVKYEDDEQIETFGIRTISCDATHGLCINGKREIIRGACIHSDNGILGARSYPEAEERKVKLLKENGYNAIRSAHNPCAKSLLDACDRLGMMVMDEYVDMWYIHKNRYDYASYIDDWYMQDIRDMVEKDFNHPSVIMYSLGNEVAETGEKRGIALFKNMKSVCKSIDPDRPVTTGVNIFFNYLYALGFGQYSDKKAEKNPNKKVGSEFFNNLAGILGDSFMKTMARLPGCDKKTCDCFAEMDVAGYNYGIERYKHDMKKYPQRVILGSETFCSDAYSFWEFAKNHPQLIGDFVWAGMDYLGEVGVGSWEYREYAPDFRHSVGWLTAGSGRIDLIGNPLGEALYTKVAFELVDQPQIAVVPVSHTGESHSPSAWKFSNAIPSWSWNGLDGKRAVVEVYSRAPIVELYLNGKRVGRKKFKRNCRFKFNVTYQGGELTAVNLDQDGKELSRNSLITAQEETVLSVVPEKTSVKSGEICFVRLKFTDKSGTVKPLERGILQVSVEGGELLAVGNACPFNELGYTGDKTDTYYGEAMAVVRAGQQDVTVSVSGNGLKGLAEIAVNRAD